MIPHAPDGALLHPASPVRPFPFWRYAAPWSVLLFVAFAWPARAQNVPAQLPVKLMDGRMRTLGDYRGKVVVLAFWTVDCTNCKAEMPHLDRLYKAHAKDGLEVIGVNLDPPRNASRVKPAVRRFGYTFPIALDPEGELAAPFDPARATPCTVVIDRRGKTRYTHLGYRVGDEVELEKQVLELLSERPKGDDTPTKQTPASPEGTS